jgi:hypothetical protein
MVHSALLDIFRCVKLTGSRDSKEPERLRVCAACDGAEITQSGRLGPSGRSLTADRVKGRVLISGTPHKPPRCLHMSCPLSHWPRV